MQPLTDPDLLAGYTTDASNLPGHADGLVRPHTVAEVAEVVAHCQAHGIPITVSAARTSTTGAAVPRGGWVLSLEHLHALEHLGEGTATAQAGINLGELQAAIERTGQLFPPDPTSRHDCTLGGAIACNASGARAFKYGPTRPWIEAIEFVSATGEVLQADRTTPVPATWPVPRWREPAVKTAAGYVPADNLLDLIIGSEGTLGVITRATIRTVPAPAGVLGVLAFFADRAGAVDFMRTARAAARAHPDGPLSPRAIEYLDAACLDLARQRVGAVPEGAGAALFCEQEIGADGDEAPLEAWFEALVEGGALADDTVVTTDDEGRARLHAVRHAIPAGLNERIVRNGMPKVGTDLAVPDHALDAMMDRYEAAPGTTVLFGHLGDNHLHLNLLPTTADELAQAKAWYAATARLAVALGGTVSAEHGIGRIKAGLLADMVGPEVLADFRALKAAVDPAWVLGRGVLLEGPTDL